MTLLKPCLPSKLVGLVVFFALAIAILPAPARAQGTAVSKDMADKYYQNCLSQPNPILSDKTKDMLCTCTAARMMKQLTVEDMRTMTQNDQNGRLALNKMLIEVYTPCMEFPVRDLVYDNCIKNRSQMSQVKNLEGLCGCMASSTAEFVAKEGPQTIQNALKSDPFISDPLGPLMSSPEFQKASQDFTMACLMDYKNKAGR